MSIKHRILLFLPFFSSLFKKNYLDCLHYLNLFVNIYSSSDHNLIHHMFSGTYSQVESRVLPRSQLVFSGVRTCEKKVKGLNARSRRNSVFNRNRDWPRSRKNTSSLDSNFDRGERVEKFIKTTVWIALAICLPMVFTF